MPVGGSYSLTLEEIAQFFTSRNLIQLYLIEPIECRQSIECKIPIEHSLILYPEIGRSIAIFIRLRSIDIVRSKWRIFNSPPRQESSPSPKMGILRGGSLCDFEKKNRKKMHYDC